MPSCFDSIDFEILPPASIVVRLLKPKLVPLLLLTLEITQHHPKRSQEASLELSAEQLQNPFTFTFPEEIDQKLIDMRLTARADGFCQQAVAYNFYVWKVITVWLAIALGAVFLFAFLIAVINLVVWMQKDDEFRPKIERFPLEPEPPEEKVLQPKPERVDTQLLGDEQSVVTDFLRAA